MSLKVSFTVALLLLAVLPIGAQPGWRDFTMYYEYTILDKNQEAISFKKNKQYKIMIDDILYEAPNIPSDSDAIFTSMNKFSNFIQINDFSLGTPQNTKPSGHSLNIKIIHMRDTMYIAQSLGRGSSYVSSIKHPTKKRHHIPLSFIPGYYYFPHWARNYFDHQPETTSKVILANWHQTHFLVSKDLFDEYAVKKKWSQLILNAADSYVLHQFTDNYIRVHQRIDTTLLTPNAASLKSPSWNSPFFALSDKESYLANLSFHYDTCNHSGSMGLMAIFTPAKNTVQIWNPIKNMNFSSSFDLVYDRFNNVYYNRTLIRDTNCRQIVYNCPFETYTYASRDEGSTWHIDSLWTKIYHRLDISKIEFLDQHHALIFRKKKVKAANKKMEIDQGTYYLVRSGQLIDSLVTPNDIHYNSNSMHYSFNRHQDTIALGLWYKGKEDIQRDTYFQPYLILQQGVWTFTIEEKAFSRNRSIPSIAKNAVVEYKHFVLKNDQELIFKNGCGSLTLTHCITNNDTYILEKDNQIYIINNSHLGYLYCSFDAGATWIFYPLALPTFESERAFLNINEDFEINYHINDWSWHNKMLHRVSYRFEKIDQKK